METLKFAMTFTRENLGKVWKQAAEPWKISRPVADIHNDRTGGQEKWIQGGNNDLYKAHASLSPDGMDMYLYIEIDAAYKSDGFWAALTMILDTKVFGSYISKKVAAYIITDELATLIEDTPKS